MGGCGACCFGGVLGREKLLLLWLRGGIGIRGWRGASLFDLNELGVGLGWGWMDLRVYKRVMGWGWS